jgi:fumarate hydratase class I
MGGAVIREEDFVQSVADALQFISYYHPADYIAHLGRAYAREQSPAAKDAIAQILTNSRMCAEGHRPICQDTGIVNVFVKAGMDVRWDTRRSLQELVDEGVRRGYLATENRLRPSIVADPLFTRKNTGDNTPAVVHVELVAGSQVDVTVAAKGGGSENKSMLTMLNPSDSLVDWVLETVPAMGAGWCPPGMLGIGVGVELGQFGVHELDGVVIASEQHAMHPLREPKSLSKVRVGPEAYRRAREQHVLDRTVERPERA